MYKSTSTSTHSEITHDLFRHFSVPQKYFDEVVYGLVKGIKVMCVFASGSVRSCHHYVWIKQISLENDEHKSHRRKVFLAILK